MSKKWPRNAPCPCGSGKKYKRCCIRKDFDWVELEDGGIGRSLPVSDEVVEVFRGLEASFVSQHGREPSHIFEGAPHSELIEHWTVEAMKQAGVEPALIYAYQQTNGLLLSDRNENKVPDTDIAVWEAAIDEYESENNCRATRRRLDDQDLDNVMRHGPQERPSGQFVERLPIPPPFTRESWGKRRLSDIVDDPEFFGYFQECLTEVTRSGRGKDYLNMFMLMMHCGDSASQQGDYEELLHEATERQFTVEELEHALESIALTCGPKGAIPNAAAAFEFLGFIGDFMTCYAEHQGTQTRLSDALQKVHGLALFSFAAAVNVELGIREDIWKL